MKNNIIIFTYYWEVRERRRCQNWFLTTEVKKDQLLKKNLKCVLQKFQSPSQSESGYGQKDLFFKCLWLQRRKNHTHLIWPVFPYVDFNWKIENKHRSVQNSILLTKSGVEKSKFSWQGIALLRIELQLLSTIWGNALTTVLRLF